MDEIEDDVASEEQQDMLAAALLTNAPIDEATPPHDGWIQEEVSDTEVVTLMVVRMIVLIAVGGVLGMVVWAILKGTWTANRVTAGG
jgi:hypothetical protein